MIVIRLIWLAVLTLALPMWVGHCFAAVDKPHKNAVFLWISGQMLFGIPSGITCAGNGILVPESPGTASGAAGADSEVREDRGSALGDFCCAIIDTAGVGGRDGIWGRR